MRPHAERVGRLDPLSTGLALDGDTMNTRRDVEVDPDERSPRSRVDAECCRIAIERANAQPLYRCGQRDAENDELAWLNRARCGSNLDRVIGAELDRRDGANRQRDANGTPIAHERIVARSSVESRSRCRRELQQNSNL